MGDTTQYRGGVSEHTHQKLLGALLVIFPLAMVFTNGVGGDGVSGNNFSSVVNYAALLWALQINFLPRTICLKNFSPRQEPSLYLLVLLLLVTYSLNFIAAEYASGKWFINTIGYIFIFSSIVVSLERLDDVGMANIHFGVDRAVATSMVLLLAMNLAIVFLDTYRFFNAVQANDSTSILFLWTKYFYVSKPPICLLFLIIVLWHAVNWLYLSFKRQLFFIVFFIVTYPLWIGIRTLGLSLLLVLAYWAIQKRLWIRMAALAALPLCAIGVVLNWQWSLEVVNKYYDRLPSLMFAVDVFINNPPGLGNGGYHVFVKEFNNSILARFGRADMGYFFWPSPESDLVYFIASFGWLSIIFFGIFIVMLVKGGQVLRGSAMLPVEKFLFLSSISILFAGISQYNAGLLIWWIYMAAGIAILIRHGKRA